VGTSRGTPLSTGPLGRDWEAGDHINTTGSLAFRVERLPASTVPDTREDRDNAASKRIVAMTVGQSQAWRHSLPLERHTSNRKRATNPPRRPFLLPQADVPTL
jgi:hypothetical protein